MTHLHTCMSLLVATDRNVERPGNIRHPREHGLHRWTVTGVNEEEGASPRPGTAVYFDTTALQNSVAIPSNSAASAVHVQL